MFPFFAQLFFNDVQSRLVFVTAQVLNDGENLRTEGEKVNRTLDDRKLSSEEIRYAAGVCCFDLDVYASMFSFYLSNYSYLHSLYLKKLIYFALYSCS